LSSALLALDEAAEKTLFSCSGIKQRILHSLLGKPMAISTKTTGTHYGDYLHLDRLLATQEPLSGGRDGKPAHDEMLFIITHQTYELWFKLILHEIGSVMPLFAAKTLDERQMGFVIGRLERVVEIQRVLVDQLTILETMTPLDFLDFRDYLIPASGFQSIQFRQIEATLGLRHTDRTPYGQDAYRTHLTDAERAKLEADEAEASLVELLNDWLERIPFLDFKDYNFWSNYRDAVDSMLRADESIIRGNEMLSEGEKAEQLKQLEVTKESFRIALDEEAHNKLRKEGGRRLSHRAFSAALFIDLYRDYPALQLPHKMLTLLGDIDELFTTWRQRHMLMVHRMIGSKIGTGGSSGHRYLQAAADKHRVFTDLFDLPTYLIPRSSLPKLPASVEQRLRFSYEAEL
jgi:tryptophan 2,3-dioxygenase